MVVCELFLEKADLKVGASMTIYRSLSQRDQHP